MEIRSIYLALGQLQETKVSLTWTSSDVQGTGVVEGRPTRVDMHRQRCRARVQLEACPRGHALSDVQDTGAVEGRATHLDLHCQRSEARGGWRVGYPPFFSHMRCYCD